MLANPRKLRLLVSVIVAAGIHLLLYASLLQLPAVPDLPLIGHSDIHTKLVSVDRTKVTSDPVEEIKSTKTSKKEAARDLRQVKTNPQKNQSLASDLSTNHLRGIIRSELSRYLRYPAVARRNGWEGSVIISMVVTQKGRINGIHLVQSSGYDVLDRATLTAIRQVRTIQKTEDMLPRDTTSITLPVQFRLTGITDGTPII